ncbi:hypothetical protein [uncultured Psychroserpens sp.]|uniref:hypothetical protein n=1 Tax=uncultured Psychroserpens sp. TaxID=255436 RepID=UPI00262C5CAB|nr:hypothetical protein [uncultured Psychroserpens sp.]
MRHIFKTAFLFFGMFSILYSCQNNDEIIQEQNRYKVPSIDKARQHVNEHIDLSSFGSNPQFRTSSNALQTDWENSKAKTYKDQPEENLDILYTPIYLPTSGHAKGFIGSVEINGDMHSKIFVLLYTESDNRMAFSGVMLIYGLDGQIEYSYRYEDGQQVASGLPGLTNTNLNRTDGNGDCESPFDSVGCLIEWIGGDWFGLSGYIQNDTVEITAGDSSTGGYIIDTDLGNPSINIPPLEGSPSGSSTAIGSPWWLENTVTPNGLSIALALEIENMALPEAQWLLNEANAEQLQSIADFLNDNRTINRDDTPEGFDDTSVDQNQMTEISQEALDLALDMINFMMEHPSAVFEPDNNPNDDYMSFSNFNEFEVFHDNLFSTINTTTTFEEAGTIRVDRHVMDGPDFFDADLVSVVRAFIPDDNNQYECLNIISGNSYIQGNETFLSWTQISNPDPNHPEGIDVQIYEDYDRIIIKIKGKFKAGIQLDILNGLFSFSESAEISLHYNYSSGEFLENYSTWYPLDY